MHRQTTGQLLVAFLRPRLTLALLPYAPDAVLKMTRAEYRASSIGDVTGFYDWLRKGAGNILGVRYTPSSGVHELTRAVRGLSYVSTPKDQSYIEILFSLKRDFDPSQSDDQAFGGNKTYRADSGEIAVCFETYFLSDTELESIRGADADWILPA